MTDLIHFEPLTEKTYDTYIRVGTKAYNQYYLHLWPDGDSSPYILNSFTRAVLKKEDCDDNTQLFLIKKHKKYVGILKLVLDCAIDHYAKEEALYLDKIYIVKETSGQGVGTKTLQFVLLRAKERGKTVVWLAAMQKGPALNFYKKNGFDIHGKTKIKFQQAIEAEKPMYILKKKIT